MEVAEAPLNVQLAFEQGTCSPPRSVIAAVLLVLAEMEADRIPAGFTFAAICRGAGATLADDCQLRVAEHRFIVATPLFPREFIEGIHIVHLQG